MFIDESLIQVEVYWKKPGVDFYLVKVAFPEIGLYINSIRVGLAKDGSELKALGPQIPYKNKPLRQVEFDFDGLFWNLIEPLVIKAVAGYQNPNEDYIPFPTDEDLEPENIKKDLFKAAEEIEKKPP